ncbi:SDR family oxidoreductase [Streptomyces sp. WI04-05B]|uniref:SDR family oxidoreductase n=1 Tax=Streptomyces TaxID=1883 RepID=UPI0029A88D93|nr:MULTISPECIES: SDR family oxidoreductase [unclassified Streptomyces]MDX2540304.1 SDR family oxidoreductase [Streptomyces sp. WI04-05B]MDX2585263.1 SDR family oxidoreductase [Streptomyces sp. WI04-05A]MDX3752399.1 SDR family oxidoreductase [Streptomyces sp. AK08-02]
MRVFVTGAGGFVGSAVVRELLGAGHEVVGMVRSDKSAALLKETGAEVYRGDLEDLDSLRAGAAASEGVIHTAYVHDFKDMADAARTDLRAVETLGEALAESGRPLLICSGTAFSPGVVATEDNPGDPTKSHMYRLASETAMMALAERGVRTSVVRLPPSVHGEGDHGFVPRLVDIARDKGVSGYPGDGANRWAAAHRFDVARLFRLALESAPAGTRLHAVAEEGVPVREIAEAIGRGLGVPVRSVPGEEVQDHFGWLGNFFALDLPASSAVTREGLGWRPEGVGLSADLGAGHYFGPAGGDTGRS